MKRFFLLLVLLAPQVFADNNIVILLDTSGSMDEQMRSIPNSKMAVAQEALISVVDDIPPQTNVGLLTFSQWEYPLQPLNKEALKKAINNTSPYGGTPLGRFLKVAADALLKKRSESPTGLFKIIVVTDGEASDGRTLGAYLPEVIARGIVIDSIGVDMDSDHTLSKLSQRYMRADDPESFKAAIKSAVAEVSIGSKGDDGTSEYELLAPIPDDLCKIINTTMANPGNQPIGEPYPQKVVDKDGAMVPLTPPKGGVFGIVVWTGIAAGCVVMAVFIGIIIVNKG
jgi:uncharacterized protein YegL